MLPGQRTWSEGGLKHNANIFTWQGISPTAIWTDMADEDAVHDVVQRGGRHGDDSGYGIFKEQSAYALGAKFGRNVLTHDCLQRYEIILYYYKAVSI